MPSTARIDTFAAAPEPRMQTLLRLQQQAFRKDMNPSRELRLDRLARLERLLDADAEREFADLIAQDFGNRSRIETVLAESIFTRSAIRHARRHLKSWMKPRRAPTALTYQPGRSYLLPASRSARSASSARGTTRCSSRWHRWSARSPPATARCSSPRN